MKQALRGVLSVPSGASTGKFEALELRDRMRRIAMMEKVIKQLPM